MLIFTVKTCLLKERLLKCDSIDQSFCCEHLRHLLHWAPYPDIPIHIHVSATANAPLIINGAPSLQTKMEYKQRCCTKRALVTHSPYILPKYVSRLSLSCHSQRDTQTSSYELKKWPGPTIAPLPVTCAMLTMYKMSSMSFSTAPIPTWFLSTGLMHLCFLPRVFMMCLLI